MTDLGARHVGAVIGGTLTRILLIFALLLVFDTARAGYPDLASGKLGPGGSNFSFLPISVTHDPPGGPWEDDPSGVPCKFFQTNDLRSIVADHHLGRAYAQDVLRRMYANGQRRISVVLWHGDGTTITNKPDHQICTIVLTDGPRLFPQHEQNLRNLVADIAAAGFEQITIRFAPSSVSTPTTWSQLDSAKLAYAKGFIAYVRALAYSQVASTAAKPKLLFDLGLELGGAWSSPDMPYPSVLREYIKQIWVWYASTYGTADTVGFSITPARWGGDINRDHTFTQLKLYSEANVGMPALMGFDVYGSDDSAGKALANIIDALKRAGFSGYRSLYIQETYWNDGSIRDRIRDVYRNTGYQFLYIQQWPLRRASPTTPADDGSDLARIEAYQPEFGLLRVGNGIYGYNGVQHYCLYASWAIFTGLTGRSNADGIPLLSSMPGGMISDGYCQPSDQLFMVGESVFYENASSHYCAYPDWETFVRLTGRTSTDGIMRFDRIPPGAIYDGACH
ncbi:hypothetical protein KXS07_01785 [Inquilinus limosus]|uniref:hypothetical protein n=1 Tax=Inquilinus limosus TaxID=171674 RepID=UPI003F17F9EE